MAVYFSLSVAAALLWSTVALGACATTAHPHCVDLSAIPNIGQQIIGAPKPPVRTDKEPPSLPKDSYNGPRIGMSNAVRRAPEIGYRWDID